MRSGFVRPRPWRRASRVSSNGSGTTTMSSAADEISRLEPTDVAKPPEGTSGNPSRPLRLLFVVSEDWYFLSHRVGLALAAARVGFDVGVATHLGGRRAGGGSLPVR